MRLFGKKKREEETRALVVMGGEGEDIPNSDAVITGQSVTIYRPPFSIGIDRQTGEGVSAQLLGQYLVAATTRLADSDLGPVSLDWTEIEGRFATVEMTIHSWSTRIEMLHPVRSISEDVAEVIRLYQEGMADKLRETHKGHQSFSKANAKISRALHMLEQLRDALRPMFSDAEYLFLSAKITAALVPTAYIPPIEREPEDLFDRTIEI